MFSSRSMPDATPVLNGPMHNFMRDFTFLKLQNPGTKRALGEFDNRGLVTRLVQVTSRFSEWRVWRGRGINGKLRPTSAALVITTHQSSNLFYKQRSTQQVMANQVISQDQKVPKQRCGMYRLSPFFFYTDLFSRPPPSITFFSNM